MISAEDDLNEDKAWRARAAGVRLERVHDMTHLEDGSPFELSASKLNQGDAPELLAYLRQLRVSCMCGYTGADAGELAAHLEEGMDGCEARNPRWVFMDPLNQLVMDGTIKTDQGARRLIGRLERVARLTGVTIVIIHHFVKSGSIGGSQGLVDAPRWVYEIEPDPAAPDCKVIHTHKCNKGGAPDIRYRIVRDGHNSRIEWVAAQAGAQAEERSWREDDLAARRAARAAVPAAATSRRPAMMYAAVVKITGRDSRLIARGVADAGMARRMCEQSPEWKALAVGGEAAGMAGGHHARAVGGRARDRHVRGRRAAREAAGSLGSPARGARAMIGKGYWATGITVKYGYSGMDRYGWAASVDFYDNGFCDDDTDGGAISTQGTLRTRYFVREGDGPDADALSAAVDAVKADAERLGINFRAGLTPSPCVYYQGDGEDEEWKPPAGGREPSPRRQGGSAGSRCTPGLADDA